MVKTDVPEGLARRYFINKTDNVKDDDCYCGPGNINISEDFHLSLRLKYLNQLPAAYNTSLTTACQKWPKIADLKPYASFLSVYRLLVNNNTISFLTHCSHSCEVPLNFVPYSELSASLLLERYAIIRA